MDPQAKPKHDNEGCSAVRRKKTYRPPDTLITAPVT